MLSFWTPERKEQVRILWDGGSSASQIAHEVGNTRNAIIGIVHRCGFPKRKFANEPKPKAPKKYAKKKFPFPTNAELALPEELIDQLDADQLCTLQELTNETCRWPFGSPGNANFFFCGSLTANLQLNRPYCSQHMRRASV